MQDGEATVTPGVIGLLVYTAGVLDVQTREPMMIREAQNGIGYVEESNGAKVSSDPLCFRCPLCKANAGENCVNFRSRAKRRQILEAPHFARVRIILDALL